MINRINERQKTRIFQMIKQLKNEQFWTIMDFLSRESFEYNERLYKEAIEASLPPRYQKQVFDMMNKIKTEWEGIEEVSMDDVLFRGLEKKMKEGNQH